MPEVIRFPAAELRTFSAGEGRGSSFSPLPNAVKDGYLHAHAMQTILVESQALYELWKDAESKPLWMENVVSVTKNETSVHWIMGDPTDAKGKRIEFDAELTADEPGRRLAWKSISGDIDQSGEVTFEPTANGRGTLVTLRETSKVPGGAAGHAIAGITKRSPKQIVIENLRHFKQLAESGEIPSVEGQPNGPRGFSGSLKSKLYGENNPTPPGTSGQA